MNKLVKKYTFMNGQELTPSTRIGLWNLSYRIFFVSNVASRCRITNFTISRTMAIKMKQQDKEEKGPIQKVKTEAIVSI